MSDNNVDGSISSLCLKEKASLSYSRIQDSILSSKVPNRDDYDSDEEFKKTSINFMIDWIDQVRQVKKEVFISTLDIYNGILGKSNNFNFTSSKNIERFNTEIERCNGSIKRRGIVSLVLAFMLPLTLPYNVLINGSQIAADMIQKKRFEKEMSNINVEKNQLREIIDDIYPLVSDLRDDFHNSNRRLDELKRKALKGENIMGELLEICSPERIGLQRIKLNSETLGFCPIEEDKLDDTNNLSVSMIDEKDTSRSYVKKNM